MTSENTDATTENASTTPTKRPRRATRAVTTPAAAAASAIDVTPASEPTSGTAAPEVAAETPVAPRRRTRKVAAAEVSATQTTPASEPPAAEGSADQVPVKKATRTRKKAAPAQDTDAQAGSSAASTPTAAPVSDAAAAEPSAPKKRTPRTTAKKDVDEVPAAATAEGTAESEAPAAPKRRRATRTAAAPAEAGAAAAESAAPAAEGTQTPASPQQEKSASTQKSATAKKSTAKKTAGRASQKAADQDSAAPADIELDASGQPAADSVEADQSAAEQAAPARRTRSRRATRPAAASTAVVEPTVEAPSEESEEDEETTEESPALDVLAAFSGVTPEPEKPTATSGRLATTAVLFQAPETPRRRRRAQAPAGSPEEIAAAAHAAEQAAAEQATEQSETDSQSDNGQDSTETGGSGRRSRGRRGGRKRNGGQSAAETAEDTTEESAQERPGAQQLVDSDEVEADETTDSQQTDEEREDSEDSGPRRRRRRGGRGRRSRAKSEGEDATDSDDESGEDESADDQSDAEQDADGEEEGTGGSSRRRRRRRRSRGGEGGESSSSSGSRSGRDEVTALRGSTRLEAKRQRRREGRDAGRRRQIITEAEFLARREAVDRSMIVREKDGRTQIAVLEDGVLVEHYVSKQAQASMVGNVYLGRVQNVLPSMEAAFVDVGRGRNAVLYAGEVNWDAAGVEGGKSRRIEQALKSGDSVLVQVTKDPIGHKGARLTSQVTLAGRYLVYVPGGGMTGISRKLPDNERSRLKKILREVVPDSAGVIVRTAAEGASEEELRADIARLQSQWEAIEKKSKTASAPSLLQGEPDMAIRVVRDIFNDDFSSLVIQGDEAWSTISGYIGELAPDLAEKMSKYTGTGDVFHDHRVDEQLAKGMDRKVWLPSGGSLVIDRTEAMTVVDVNTGKFTGAGGTLEETVTRNNLEAAEEIVRQLRLRDIGGIIVIDFIDMVLESNRDLVLRRLVECLGRDRTKHQVAEVTSLGLVQMTRKRVGQGLVEAFSETCEHCHGRGFIVHSEPVEKSGGNNGGQQHQHQPEKPAAEGGESKRSRRKRGGSAAAATVAAEKEQVPVLPEAREQVKATLATIAAAAAHAHHDEEPAAGEAQSAPEQSKPVLDVIAALGELGEQSSTPGDEPADEPALELTAVDPSLFEDGEPMPEAPLEELADGAEQPEE